MNPKLQQLLIRMSKLAIYTIILSLSIGITVAHDLEAQRKSLNEINVRVSYKGNNLLDLLKDLERSSDFTFAYSSEKMTEKSVAIQEGVWNMETLLKEISVQARISIKRVNETITVKTVNRESSLPEVSDSMNAEIEVSGNVTDESGEPLPGATVTQKGTTRGTVTNAEGDFTLNVEEGSTLLVSFIGYISQELQVGSQNTTINVQLIQDITSLEEVIVVGYGTVKKSDLTGSVVSLQSDDLNEGVNTTIDQMMQGRAAGVNVVQNSSEPGGGVSISIRGASSITAGTGPLYVIDGLPIDNSVPIGGGGEGYVATRAPRNPLSSINPADIQSIEILKDASATAIYGARGANGVILVTTKNGRKGQLEINYDGYTGIQNVANRIDLLSPTEYKQVLNDIIDDGGGSGADHIGDIPNGGTDWQDQLYVDNAKVQSHNLSFSGGNESTNYFISTNYFDQDGVVTSSSFKRYGARVNLNYSASEKFKVGLNMSTNFSKDDYVPVGFGINGEAGAIYAALNMDPTLPVYNDDGTYAVSPIIDIDNPLALANGTNATGKTFRTYGTIFGEYFVLPELSFKLNIGGDALNTRRDTYVNRETRKGAPAGGIATIQQSIQSNYLVEGTVNYNKRIDIHSFNIVAGITTQQFNNEYTSMTARGFPADVTGTYNMNLGDASTFRQGSNRETNKLISYLGRVNYGLLDRYLLTASLRVDGSSRFGQNHKFGYFPSFALGWKVLDEPFLSGSGLLSELKFRTSYGETGNQEIGNYTSVSTFVAGPVAVFDEQIISTTNPSRLPNPDLKWETTRQFDVGFDFGVLEDRIYGTVDYYTKTTSDMLMQLPVPPSSAYDSKLVNIGSIKNQGFELSVNSVNLTGNLKWTTGVNLATLKNEVLDIGGLGQIIGGSAGFASQIWIIEEGSPLRSFYGYEIEGIWQEDDDFSETTDNVNPGDIKYRDVNGDLTVNAEDRVLLGNSFPDLIYSISNSFTYGNFDLTIFFEGVEGVSMLNNNLVDAYFPIQFQRNRFAEPYLNRWTAENPSNEYPSFVNPTSQGQKVINSYTVSDASYLRLKTLTLSYNLPMLGKVIKSGSIYVTGQNLATFTNYNGTDPALNPNGNANIRIDYNAYPTSRIFLLGVKLKF